MNQIGGKGFAYILRKWQSILPGALTTNNKLPVIPIDIFDHHMNHFPGA
jgi:hypothetical protein